MKNRLRTFLTPGWVLAAVLAVAFAYLAFTVLAPWQLGKNEAVQARNDHLREAFETEPAPIGEVFHNGTIAPGDEWRRVILQGEYLPDKEVVLRNRPVEQSPAVQVLTVFRTTDRREFLVNRGWQPPSDGNVPGYDPAPAGPVELKAYARVDEQAPERAPIPDGGTIQVYGINTAQISGLLDQPLATDWVQLAPDQPGGLRDIPLPQLTSGPYLSYGIQWIFFGIAAPLAVAWFVYAEIRERRRERAEQAEHEEFLRQATAGKAPGAAVPAVAAQLAEPAEDGGEAKVEADVPPQDPEEAAREAAEAERARRMARRYGDSGHNLDLQRSRRRGDRF